VYYKTKTGIEVTVFRFWVYNNQYHCLVLEGKTIEPRYTT
jgi:hypothetical protein